MQTNFANDYTKLDYTFDINRFNKLYNDYINKVRSEERSTEKERLEKLNKEFIEGKQISDLTFWELFFNMKDAINDVFNDIFQLKFDKNTLTKNNRLFYIGLFLILIVFIVFILDKLFSGGTAKSTPTNTSKNYYKIYVPNNLALAEPKLNK